jgi:hypothetical protein
MISDYGIADYCDSAWSQWHRWHHKRSLVNPPPPIFYCVNVIDIVYLYTVQLFSLAHRIQSLGIPLVPLLVTYHVSFQRLDLYSHVYCTRFTFCYLVYYRKAHSRASHDSVLQSFTEYFNQKRYI